MGNSQSLVGLLHGVLLSKDKKHVHLTQYLSKCDGEVLMWAFCGSRDMSARNIIFVRELLRYAVKYGLIDVYVSAMQYSGLKLDEHYKYIVYGSLEFASGVVNGVSMSIGPRALATRKMILILMAMPNKRWNGNLEIVCGYVNELIDNGQMISNFNEWHTYERATNVYGLIISCRDRELFRRHKVVDVICDLYAGTKPYHLGCVDKLVGSLIETKCEWMFDEFKKRSGIDKFLAMKKLTYVSRMYFLRGQAGLITRDQYVDGEALYRGWLEGDVARLAYDRILYQWVNTQYVTAGVLQSAWDLREYVGLNYIPNDNLMVV